MKTKLITLLFILFFLSAPQVNAHSGRTDAYGCHNCRVGSCAGEYHCHNGGSSGGYGGYVAPRYILPAPKNPDNGTWETKPSSSNWCNYDLTMSWDKPLNADRYSIAASKYAGADPGPNPDTSDTTFTFNNLAPGKWYVNIKAANSERWASNITYWTIDLPKPTPYLTAYVSGDKMEYDLSCLEKVEGPQEFINYLETYNHPPKGSVMLSSTEPTTLTVKGWDFNGKEYTQTLSYNPLITSDTESNDTSKDNSGWWSLLILGGLFGWGLIGAAWDKLKKILHRSS